MIEFTVRLGPISRIGKLKWEKNDFILKVYNPVSTRRCFDVDSTFFERCERQNNVEYLMGTKCLKKK